MLAEYSSSSTFPPLRVRNLTQRWDRGYLWRSDVTMTLYRYRAGCWEMYYDGRWAACEDDRGMTMIYHLTAQHGEMFMRVGKVV